MVLGYQPLISFKGPGFTNSSGHSFTTRMLYTVVPAQLYYAPKTIDTLHEAMVRDMNSLYFDGLSVSSEGTSYTYRFVPVMLKGDWPYLRSSFRQYPAGCGKGHDAAVLGAWLHDELQLVDETTIAEQFLDIFKLLRWTLQAVNRYWRTLYKYGVWLPREVTQTALYSKEGYGQRAVHAADVGRLWKTTTGGAVAL
ncbi:unnamed protein product [Symbiodinium natans]|uniref:Uncharacterized protein n=1 Tax=Symbiodinium natans TaxID=878477 RepID=A0A812GYL2_9DINO|nr:unnamed protein product [Symbiodinium natans]